MAASSLQIQSDHQLLTAATLPEMPLENNGNLPR
jgi:hypothetical protein